MKPTRGPAATRKGIACLVGIFLLSRAVVAWLGVRFEAGNLTWYWQFVDVRLLETDLIRSVGYLHSQPPLFNLFLGVVLKGTPNHPSLAFSAVYLALGLVLVLSAYGTMVGLGVGPRTSVGLAALLTVGPASILYENFLFYTYPTAALLSLSAFVCVRFFQTRRRREAALLFSVLAALALLRSLFHLSWMLAILALLSFSLRREPHMRRQLIMASVVPVLIVTGLYAKNYMLFGSFSASSWLGMNVLPMTTAFVDRRHLDDLHARGDISELYQVETPSTGVFTFLENYPRHFTAATQTGIPVLDAKAKTGIHPAYGRPTPNFNHAVFLDISRQCLRDAVRIAEAHPEGYLLSVAANLAEYFRPAETYFHPSWSPNAALLSDYTPLYDLVVKGTVPERAGAEFNRSLLDRFRGKALSFALLLPLLIFCSLRLVGRRRDDSGVSGPVLFLLFNVLYVTVVANTMNRGESYRLFFVIEPLVFVLAGVVFDESVRRGARSHAEGAAAPEK